MDLTTFLVTVFCLVDDWLTGQHLQLRRRGPRPVLADSEVLTIECAGEYLGIDTDAGLYAYFREHWGDWFPALRTVHRTTFTRQAANLWAVKQRLHQHLLTQVGYDPAITLVDSVAIPVCRFARAYRCRRLRELAAWGHDPVAKQTYLGLRAHLRAHLRVCWPGVIVDGRLAPATSRTWLSRRSCWPGGQAGCWPTATTAAPGWPPSSGARAAGCLRHPGAHGAHHDRHAAGRGHHRGCRCGSRPGWSAGAGESRP